MVVFKNKTKQKWAYLRISLRKFIDDYDGDNGAAAVVAAAAAAAADDDDDCDDDDDEIS